MNKLTTILLLFELVALLSISYLFILKSIGNTQMPPILKFIIVIIFSIIFIKIIDRKL